MEYLGAELPVSDIVISELRIKVVDCRSNSSISNARVDKIVISGNGKSITKQFDRTKVKDEIATSGAEGSIEALQRLGYGEKDTKKKTYDATWLGHYNSYWKDRVTDFMELKSGETPPDAMMEYIIKEYNSHRCTDTNGILRVQIPNPMMENGSIKVEVKFFDFPIVLESEVCRPNENNGGGTGFSVVWNGTQSTDWNSGFGWEIVYNNKRSELKYSEEMELSYNNTSQDFDASSLSTYYNSEDDNSGHLVLLGMVWCQPVWDGIADNGSQSYVQDNTLRNLNMHIVTRYAGSGNGKTYGTTRHQEVSSNVREAIDLYTITGQSLLFAVHAGQSTCNNTPKSEAGRNVLISWGNRRLRYLHFHRIEISSSYIMCGLKLGIAGRTGNFVALQYRTEANDYQPSSKYPDHVHLDDGYGTHATGILSFRNEIDEFNRICIPNYSYPLLYPCFCEVSLATDSPSECNFSSTVFASSCWAARELRCPYMADENKRLRRIQAQLRHLGHLSGSIDGNWGGLPSSRKSTIGSTRRAIYNFKAQNALTQGSTSSFIQADYDMNELDENRLNELAPIQRVRLRERAIPQIAPLPIEPLQINPIIIPNISL